MLKDVWAVVLIATPSLGENRSHIGASSFLLSHQHETKRSFLVYIKCIAFPKICCPGSFI